MENQKTSIASIATLYKNVVESFQKRPGVLNGREVSYHDNQDPEGNLRDENWFTFGDSRITTGLCVSYSQALLNSQVFQMLLKKRNAIAKLVSIEIKEQFWGYCKPSMIQNKWHTAILVRDWVVVNNGESEQTVYFIVDPTCAQFGNQFAGKLVWDFNTWCNTFRSSIDTHELTGFDGDELVHTLGTIKYNSKSTDIVTHYKNRLKSIATLDDVQRNIFAEFLSDGLTLMNKKISYSTLSDNDIKFANSLNTIINRLPLIQNNEQYTVFCFDTKELALRWIRMFIESDYIMPQYAITSNSINSWFEYMGIETNYGIETNNDFTYVILRLKDCYLPSIADVVDNMVSFVPYGLKFDCNPETDIYNMGKELATDVYNADVKTNTICINLKRL